MHTFRLVVINAGVRGCNVDGHGNTVPGLGKIRKTAETQLRSKSGRKASSQRVISTSFSFISSSSSNHAVVGTAFSSATIPMSRSFTGVLSRMFPAYGLGERGPRPLPLDDRERKNGGRRLEDLREGLDVRSDALGLEK